MVLIIQNILAVVAGGQGTCAGKELGQCCSFVRKVVGVVFGVVFLGLRIFGFWFFWCGVFFFFLVWFCDEVFCVEYLVVLLYTIILENLLLRPVFPGIIRQ